MICGGDDPGSTACYKYNKTGNDWEAMVSLSSPLDEEGSMIALNDDEVLIVFKGMSRNVQKSVTGIAW